MLKRKKEKNSTVQLTRIIPVPQDVTFGPECKQSRDQNYSVSPNVESRRKNSHDTVELRHKTGESVQKNLKSQNNGELELFTYQIGSQQQERNSQDELRRRNLLFLQNQIMTELQTKVQQKHRKLRQSEDLTPILESRFRRPLSENMSHSTSSIRSKSLDLPEESDAPEEEARSTNGKAKFNIYVLERAESESKRENMFDQIFSSTGTSPSPSENKILPVPYRNERRSSSTKVISTSDHARIMECSRDQHVHLKAVSLGGLLDRENQDGVRCGTIAQEDILSKNDSDNVEPNLHRNVRHCFSSSDEMMIQSRHEKVRVTSVPDFSSMNILEKENLYSTIDDEITQRRKLDTSTNIYDTVLSPVHSKKSVREGILNPEEYQVEFESESIYEKLEDVSILPEMELTEEGMCSLNPQEKCSQDLESLKEELAAKEFELQLLKKENLDLVKKNDVLEKEWNIEKDILQTTVEQKVEIGCLREAMESERRLSAQLAEEVEELRTHRKNRSIASLQERLLHTEELYQGLMNRLEEEQKDRNYMQDKDSIQMHEIKNIEYIKQNIAKGSFGSVSLIRVHGMPCIKKSLHKILIGYGTEEDVDQNQKAAIKEKFYRECNLLWKMQHPNIVQFMGIHYHGEGESRQISLIMEFLPANLDHCIMQCKAEGIIIPLSIKLSILRDVAYGLTQLHMKWIIHRDLSASNILLTSSMRAKIADFGMSKLTRSGTLMKHTAAPGAMYIMPPEALEEDPQYSVQLDIFSFGIISLYLLLQKIPNPTKDTLTSIHVENKQIAIGKRLNYLNEVGKINMTMENVIFNCLQDQPDRRPTVRKLTRDISYCISKIKYDAHGDMIWMMQTNFGKRLQMSPEDLFL